MNWQPKDHVRLVFHATFKRFSGAEVQSIKGLLTELGDYDVEYAFVQLNEQHPYILFDKTQAGVFDYETKRTKGAYAPERGQYLELGKREVLLSLTGPQEVKRPEDGTPRPLFLSLHRDSTFTDMTYLTRQVFTFSCHSWRTFLPGSIPVTIQYSNLIANALGHLSLMDRWNPDNAGSYRKDAMDAVTTTSDFLLADARVALRRRVDDVARTELSAAFAAWLLPSTETDAEFAALVGDAAMREGALQDFQTVAILGFGAHAGILCAKQIEALKKGIRRLAGREVVIDGLPVGFCSDPVGILGVALGTKTVADAELTDQVLNWICKFLKNSYDADRTEDWHRCLLAAADRQLGNPLNLSVPKSPAAADVRTTLVAKGVIESGDDDATDKDGQQTLRLAMRELPDELPCDRAALRLAAIESVIQAAIPSVGGKNAAESAKRSGALSDRDIQVHDVIGGERFRTLTNAEIMKEATVKKRLRTDFDLEPGGDAAKRCLDRIREAKGYPLSREVTKKRAAQNQTTGKNGQRRAS